MNQFTTFYSYIVMSVSVHLHVCVYISFFLVLGSTIDALVVCVVTEAIFAAMSLSTVLNLGMGCLH